MGDHDQERDQEGPDDPRAAERQHAAGASEVGRPPMPEPDQRARDSLERALARGRLAWPGGPTLELRQWVKLEGLGMGGAPALAFARGREAAAQLCLSPDELLLVAAGYGGATPALVERHLARAGRVA